jgi:uncharacterized alkaline shock family protein YloU
VADDAELKGSEEAALSISPDVGVADGVVATYVADAVSALPGVAGLHASSWRSLSRLQHDGFREPVVVHSASPGSVDLEVHVRVAWGVEIPRLAQEVEDVVRRRVEAMLDLHVGKVTLYVDEVEAPDHA